MSAPRHPDLAKDSEDILLVDASDLPLGSATKERAHREGLLHRAFSVFVFNPRGEWLMQRRALDKYHSGGLWTNTCCSHPRPGEVIQAAAERRLTEEMGFTCPLEEAFSFTYRAEFDNGVTEHEFDHVFVGRHDGKVEPDPAEVHEYGWRRGDELAADLEANPDDYSPWFRIAFARVMRHVVSRSAGS